MLTMAEQWREILAHFASLRDATRRSQGSPHGDPRNTSHRQSSRHMPTPR
jgi:type VI protein secretion system component VasF